MKILFCDNHLLVVDKEGGISTQPALEEAAKKWIKEKYAKKGNVFLHPIHRLDTPTSGIVLFARTSKSLTRLNAAMRERKMEKTYLGLVEGTLEMQEGVLEHWHRHGSHRAFIFQEKVVESKKALLKYKVLEVKDQTTLLPMSLIEIKLETGRYHQIRAQFAFLGHPIVGDQKYGSHASFSTIPLHHARFSFFHPISNEKLSFEAPLPNDWQLAR